MKVLTAIKFKCAKGHEWTSAVGIMWCEMSECPYCDEEKAEDRAAVAWKGVFEEILLPVQEKSRIPKLGW